MNRFASSSSLRGLLSPVRHLPLPEDARGLLLELAIAHADEEGHLVLGKTLERVRVALGHSAVLVREEDLEEIKKK